MTLAQPYVLPLRQISTEKTYQVDGEPLLLKSFECENHLPPHMFSWVRGN